MSPRLGILLGKSSGSIVRTGLGLGLLFGCTGEQPDSMAARSEPEAARTSEWFVDVAREWGLDFTHVNGMTGEHYIVEMMGGGAALIDYDSDGDLDVYLVQGGDLGGDADGGTAGPEKMSDRLYRNDLDENSRVARFTDVTATSGDLGTGYGMGAIAADYDNDGWTDLYVTNYGANQLLRNRGDGTFEDVTMSAGPGDARWSAAATFVDFDRDGWLDLYVGNYIRFSPSSHTPCPTPSGVETYCGPGAYPSQHDSLWRKRGDGTFEEVSGRAGVRRENPAATLGVIAADLDANGWIDLYVANDSTANNLWMNQGEGRFVDRALLAGVAVNKAGQPEASMGVDAGDYDGDGDLDLFLAHLSQESNTLYRNGGTGLFADVSTESGLGPASMPATAFGAAWVDYDNDGWLDILAVNGAVVGLEALLRVGDPFPLHQPNQLFRNLGTGRFEGVSALAGAAFEVSEVSRGAAYGDLDNDGDTDVVVVNNNGPVRLLLNQLGQDAGWVGVRVVEHGRDALGAEVSIEAGDGPPQLRRVHTDGSYAASNDPRVLVGLGNTRQAVVRVTVRWPDGSRETWLDVPAGVYSTLRRGSGGATP